MSLAASLWIGDLTPQEVAVVRHAYDAGGLHEEDHAGAFSLAMSVLRALRPNVPLSALVTELDRLLTEASIA